MMVDVLGKICFLSADGSDILYFFLGMFVFLVADGSGILPMIISPYGRWTRGYEKRQIFTRAENNP